jgi:tetratricopeptide (TPR) repeat protein
MNFKRHRFWVVWFLPLAMLTLITGFSVQTYRRKAWGMDLKRSKQAMQEGRFHLARDQLSRLAASWTNQGEVYVLLGECELARGRRQAAFDAWARVPLESPHFHRAALLLATHRINSGRYTPAEEVLIRALSRPGGEKDYDLERALSRLYRFEGRFDDVRHILRRSWFHSPDPAGVLRELWLLDHSPMPVESWGVALDNANGDDDRVWLGRARRSTMTGQFAEAARWLNLCESRRHDDPALWQASLDLALAADDVARFWSSATHLPDDRITDSEVLALRAWLSERQGDHETERRELEILVKDRPGNTRAVERLAALTYESGKAVDAERLHRLKAQADNAKDRMRRILLDESQMLAHAAELASLSTILNRDFDAEGWLLLEQARSIGTGSGHIAFDHPAGLPEALLDSARTLSARYSSLVAPSAGTAGTLADRLSDLRTVATLARAASSSAGSSYEPRPGNPSVATLRFRDDAEAVGLRFLFDNGQTTEHLLPETMSGGVGLLDYDGDGWLDVYCVQGGSLGARAGFPDSATDQHDRLYRNQGNGTFRDVTGDSGLKALLRNRGYGLGVAVGDFDNDGHPDLFLTRLRTYVLLRNRGDGTFEDVTDQVGLTGIRDIPTSAAFADLDNDGDLDLYVCHYMRWDPEHPQVCTNDKGEYFYCDPSKVEPAPDHVFRNDGGRFTEVTTLAGFVDPAGRGLGVVAADVNDDNLVDLFVANDGTANFLFLNKGGFRFEETALTSGVAGNASGGFQAGMGVACGDLDGDGRPDLMVTNFYGEGTTLYRNLGRDLFTDDSSSAGIGLASRYLLGFGIALVDVGNRGRLDVVTTNGHVNDNRPFYPYAMPARLYANRPSASGFKLVDVSDQAGPPWLVPRVGRGLAAGDLDNDGRVDVLIVAQNEPLAYFHNLSESRGHFVTFRLEGVKSNRDGVGARVAVVSDGHRQVLMRQGGGSYQSAHDTRLHFGLGESARVDSLEVGWPCGHVDHWSALAADTGYLLREGSARVRPLAGFPAKMDPEK